MIAIWLTISLSAFTTLLIPAIWLLIRIAVKWTRTEDRVGNLVDKVTELVEDKEKVHIAMYSQMKADRDATDQRLQWLERMWMERGKS